MAIEYFYKMNKTGKRFYLQIWKREGDNKELVAHLGPAEKLVTKLQAAGILKDQTKRKR